MEAAWSQQDQQHQQHQQQHQQQHDANADAQEFAGHHAFNEAWSGVDSSANTSTDKGGLGAAWNDTAPPGNRFLNNTNTYTILLKYYQYYNLNTLSQSALHRPVWLSVALL
jgi:hypothetical protein